eukprot:GHVS01103333.1.p1 GENE.GHVS01103333.1~~GHVS01103333.1.p1  ORF type:complete len:355 (-),score=20.60 GHVS01103333.1:677-1741(-)
MHCLLAFLYVGIGLLLTLLIPKGVESAESPVPRMSVFQYDFATIQREIPTWLPKLVVNVKMPKLVANVKKKVFGVVVSKRGTPEKDQKSWINSSATKVSGVSNKDGKKVIDFKRYNVGDFDQFLATFDGYSDDGFTFASVPYRLSEYRDVCDTDADKEIKYGLNSLPLKFFNLQEYDQALDVLVAAKQSNMQWHIVHDYNRIFEKAMNDMTTNFIIGIYDIPADNAIMSCYFHRNGSSEGGSDCGPKSYRTEVSPAGVESKVFSQFVLLREAELEAIKECLARTLTQGAEAVRDDVCSLTLMYTVKGDDSKQQFPQKWNMQTDLVDSPEIGTVTYISWVPDKVLYVPPHFIPNP